MQASCAALSPRPKSSRLVEAKETLRVLLDKLPGDCTLDDVLYHLYVIHCVGRGLEDLDADRCISHEEVETELRRRWLGDAGSSRAGAATAPLDAVVQTLLVDRLAAARAGGAAVGEQGVGVADREQRARQAHRLLEEDFLLAEARREPRLLHDRVELGAHAAQHDRDAARANAVEEAAEQGEADRVGIADA